MAYGEFAKIYDELINEDINYNEMVDFILKVCNENNIKFNDYLDIACGTGNITVRLAKHFKDIYGVDLSEDMLREAFDKLKSERIKGKIICQDMTELSLNRKFDLITSVLDSTNYITDIEGLKKYFKGVYDHLKDDGIFIFDINSYYKLSEILGNNIYTYSEEEHIERAYKESEIEEILQELNLNIINKFDGYLNNNVQANSERIVYIVKKK
ncbi:class I SAM-dependent DNA methyltransferase [Clostridium sp. ETTB3]